MFDEITNGMLEDPVFMTVFFVFGVKKFFSQGVVSAGSLLLLVSISLCASRLAKVCFHTVAHPDTTNTVEHTQQPEQSGMPPQTAHTDSTPYESSHDGPEWQSMIRYLAGQNTNALAALAALKAHVMELVA